MMLGWRGSGGIEIGMSGCGQMRGVGRRGMMGMGIGEIGGSIGEGSIVGGVEVGS